ncbi:MAG: T9SS type A sorting domain-containing protein [Flavobacteriales bacterium]|jgi:hypothetical protein|nr:T9SS type A sorting domain-containing protein [Flavobacteriales bacterium]
MRLFLLFSLLICGFLIVNGQTNNKIKPYTFQNKLSITPTPLQLPSFDLDRVIEEEHANRINKSGMYRFGYEHQTNIDFKEEATWNLLPNGDQIALLKLKSDGALSINIIFSNFYLPDGAYLHVYNTEKTTLVGAYTSYNNNNSNILGTELIKGDEMIIEYYQPQNTLTTPQLLIGTVVHGFEDINNWYGQLKVNESGGCNMDVICADGIPWEKEIRSVARIVNGGGLCSGSLVNNTAQDGTPYFLTANHCNPQSMGSAIFRFNYNSPICGSQITANSQDAVDNHTINGSSLKARNAGSDFGLVELNTIPPDNYNVYYAGWNNSGNTPTQTVGIHHPRGDVKKLAFDEDAPVSGTFGTSITNGEWRILQWERNTTTEGGSSGSGLWDENHLIVGQLHGGQANCANSVNDYYGKFSVSWDGTSSTTRLKDWLDPQNSGATSLNGWDPNASDNDVYMVAILTPETTNCGNAVTPKILIKNNGEEALSTITFNYGTNGNILSSYNWSGNLATNDTLSITLPSTGVIPQGENSITIISNNPNETEDGDHSNDTLTTTFTNNQNCLAYPNPFRDQLTINFESDKINDLPVEIFLTDVQGKQLWSSTHDANANNELTINTSQLAKGIYLLEIRYAKESTLQKLIKN